MRRLTRRLFTLCSAVCLAVCVPVPAGGAEIVSCSGPGAWAAIRDAEVYSYWSAFRVVLLLVPTLYVLLRSGRPGLAAVHLLLLALHPAWTVSARTGDCGGFKVVASTAFIVLAAASVGEAAVVARYFRKPWRPAAAGHCPRCGYDLRATPGRCPECGAGRRRQKKRRRSPPRPCADPPARRVVE